MIGDARFCFTYGDGLADVPVKEVIAGHEAQGCLATLTAVRAPARFGKLDFNDAGTRVQQFMEKGDGESWINDSAADAYVANEFGGENGVVSTSE